MCPNECQPSSRTIHPHGWGSIFIEFLLQWNAPQTSLPFSLSWIGNELSGFSFSAQAHLTGCLTPPLAIISALNFIDAPYMLSGKRKLAWRTSPPQGRPASKQPLCLNEPFRLSKVSRSTPGIPATPSFAKPNKSSGCPCRSRCQTHPGRIR